MIIPNIRKNQTCSKPPTGYLCVMMQHEGALIYYVEAIEIKYSHNIPCMVSNRYQRKPPKRYLDMTVRRGPGVRFLSVFYFFCLKSRISILMFYGFGVFRKDLKHISTIWTRLDLWLAAGSRRDPAKLKPRRNFRGRTSRKMWKIKGSPTKLIYTGRFPDLC